MAIEQLSILVENKQGALAEIIRLLADAGIDMRAMSIADTQEFGILRLIVNDTEKARALILENGHIAHVTPVTAVEITDQAGGLSQVLQVLTDAGINIEYLYAFITVSGKNACVVLRVEDNDIAAGILKKNGMTVMDATSIANL